MPPRVGDYRGWIDGYKHVVVVAPFIPSLARYCRDRILYRGTVEGHRVDWRDQEEETERDATADR